MNQITPKALKARFDAGEDIELIDIREDWELRQASIDRAVHIPMNDIPESLDRLTKDKPVVLMCHLGQRSAYVVEWLMAQGYQNVYSLDGGIDAWARDVDPSVEHTR